MFHSPQLCQVRLVPGGAGDVDPLSQELRRGGERGRVGGAVLGSPMATSNPVGDRPGQDPGRVRGSWLCPLPTKAMPQLRDGQFASAVLSRPLCARLSLLSSH